MLEVESEAVLFFFFSIFLEGRKEKGKRERTAFAACTALVCTMAGPESSPGLPTWHGMKAEDMKGTFPQVGS